MGGTKFCTTVGKYVGSMYRCANAHCSKAGQLCANSVNVLKEESKVLLARVSNLFKTVGNDSRMAVLETKRKEDFARLGEELYRLEEEEPGRLDPEYKSLKEILDCVKEDQSRIDKIEREIHAQRRKMQEKIVFKHALKQLESQERHARLSALRVLKRQGNKEAISRVAKLLEDPDPKVRESARTTIQKLSQSAKKTLERRSVSSNSEEVKP